MSGKALEESSIIISIGTAFLRPPLPVSHATLRANTCSCWQLLPPFGKRRPFDFRIQRIGAHTNVAYRVVSRCRPPTGKRDHIKFIRPLYSRLKPLSNVFAEVFHPSSAVLLCVHLSVGRTGENNCARFGGRPSKLPPSLPPYGP